MMQSVSLLSASIASRISQNYGLRAYLLNSRISPHFGLFNAQFASKARSKKPKTEAHQPSVISSCNRNGINECAIGNPAIPIKNADEATNEILAKDASKADLKMLRIPNDKLNDVVAHQRQSFFCNDPLHKALGICQDEAALNGEAEYAKKTIEEGMSVMALNEDGKVVAAHLNGMMCPGSIERELEALGEPKTAFEKLLYVKYKANLKVNLFEKFGVVAIYEMKMASVDEQFQCPNIGFEALKMDEQIARDAGYKLIKAEASGVYTENLLEKMGFVTVSETRYDSLLDKEGNIMVPVQEPHTSFKIMVKKLD